MNAQGDRPADVFGYCANVYSYNDFQESFPSTADKQKAIKEAGEIIEENKMKALGTIIPNLLVHLWYPDSIFSQTTDTFPINVFCVVDKAPMLRGDSDSITRNTFEWIGGMEREGTDLGNDDNTIEYIIPSGEE